MRTNAVDVVDSASWNPDNLTSFTGSAVSPPDEEVGDGTEADYSWTFTPLN